MRVTCRHCKGKGFCIHPDFDGGPLVDWCCDCGGAGEWEAEPPRWSTLGPVLLAAAGQMPVRDVPRVEIRPVWRHPEDESSLVERWKESIR